MGGSSVEVTITGHLDVCCMPHLSDLRFDASPVTFAAEDRVQNSVISRSERGGGEAFPELLAGGQGPGPEDVHADLVAADGAHAWSWIVRA